MFEPARPAEGSIAAPLEALADLQRRGSCATSAQQRDGGTGQASARHRRDRLRAEPVQSRASSTTTRSSTLWPKMGIAYVPFFPLGGFSPLQSATLSEVAARLRATPMQVALAWLLQRAPNILLIPGTSSCRTFART
jgi:hypothetical protein